MTPFVDNVFLEGACGHEFAWPTTGGAAPSDGVCEEHGLTALWAQRLEPRKDRTLPRGKFISRATNIYPQSAA